MWNSCSRSDSPSPTSRRLWSRWRAPPSPRKWSRQNDTLALAEASAQVVANTDGLSAPGRITPVGGLSNSAPSEPLEPQRRVAPLSPGRFELRLTISQDLHDKL